MFTVLVCTAVAISPSVVCALLDSDEWETREAVTKTVIDNWPVVAYALPAAFRHPSPEVRYRASHIRNQVLGRARKRANTIVTATPHAPCIDAVWFQPQTRHYQPVTPFEHKISEAYGPRVGVCLGTTQSAYADYRMATKRMMSDLLTAGAPEWGVNCLLQWMYAKDAAYFGANFGDSRLCPADQLFWPFGP